VHNLKKVWNGLKEREEILWENGNLEEKNLDLDIFVEFCFEIELIVGQPPLLNEGEGDSPRACKA